MKKLIFCFVVVLLTINCATAQRMQKNDGLINIGLGVGPGVGVSASYDYGLVDSWGPGIFTIGGIAGINNRGDRIHNYMHDGEKYRETIFSLAPRVSYRYAFDDEPFEVYLTAMLGVSYHAYSRFYSNNFSLFGGAAVGGRFFATQNLSVFAELGYTTSIVTMGISIAL